MLLILFYSQTYLYLVDSEQDYEHFGVMNGLVRAVSIPRHFLIDTKILFSHLMCANTSVPHSFLQPNVPPFSNLRAKIWVFWMINGLVCEVSQLRHLLNNTNIFYIFHVMCANTWTINFKCCSSFFSQAYLRLADSEQEFVCFGVVNGLVRGVPYQYQGTSWMIQTSFVCHMWGVETLERQNLSVAHPFL